jgi:YegS/Rv2252/BmrU family lipid kinase
MSRKKACPIINPRMGENITKLPDIIAVLSAAGWSTDIALKEYGGHTMELAAKAAEKGYDLVIAFGGDGTLNQVVNGVMNEKDQHSTVGLIPGGTANVWANEISVPGDPVKAALSLVGSQVRKADIGHVAVERLTFPGQTGAVSAAEIAAPNGGEKTGKVNAKSKARHHFLLMAGLGIDAAIMSNVSKPLKYRVGPLAVAASVLKELPKRHPFPLEIRAASGVDQDEFLWRGEALQVVIGNTRKYADIVEMTPQAHIDDGVLDVCVITAGEPLTTIQQITSLLLRRKPDNTTAEYFHGAHLIITAPASVGLQLDGSAVKLKDYLCKPALSSGVEGPVAANESAQNTDEVTLQTETQEAQSEVPEHIVEIEEQGRKVTVVGVSQYQDKKGQTYIVAGGTPKQGNGETKPVAFRINNDTIVFRRSGERVLSAFIGALPEGAEIVVEGKQSKRGVISTQKVVI